jgi:hypothetical protein
MFTKSFITLVLSFCLIISLPAFCDEPNYAPGEVLVRFAPQEDGEYFRGAGKEALVESICGGTIEDESDFVPPVPERDALRQRDGQAISDLPAPVGREQGVVKIVENILRKIVTNRLECGLIL